MQHASTETVLPRAVRLQVKTMQERINARSAAPQAPAPAQQPTDEPAAVTSPAVNDPPQPASAPAAAPAAPVQSDLSASGADPRENSVDYWRERFKVMQGINDKLRRDHESALEARDRQLTELNARMAELEKAGPRNPETPNIKLFFTDEQIDRFGEEQCTAMATAAMTAARDQAQRIVEAEVAPIKQRAQAEDATKARTAQDAFWSKLDELIAKIPDAGNRTIWEINEEPAWLNWLREPDANGEARQKHLTRHQRELNAQGVANLVSEYLRKSAPNLPTPPVTPSGGAGSSGEPLVHGQSVNGKGYPSQAEYMDFTKRASTIRNPRDPRYVTDKERAEMEARLKLRSVGGR